MFLRVSRVCLVSFAWLVPCLGSPTEPDGDVDVGPAAEATPTLDSQPIQLTTSRALATNRHADRPTYSRVLSDSLDWLEIGFEHRTRFEIRDDFYRFDQESDEQFLMRTRGFLGVRNQLDPLRFAFEFQDARDFESSFQETSRSINETDILQLFGELHFADTSPTGGPLSVRGGRMSFDGVDRRLLARNRFRNTTNAFDGGRVRLGDETTRWELDLFAMAPVRRELRSLDSTDHERMFYGVTAYLRGLGPGLTLEPFFFLLDEDRHGTDQVDREIHTLGLHGFGLLGTTGLDYDWNVSYQVGDVGSGDHRALAAHAELGYNWEKEWKPRLALWFNYASGDDDPDDDDNERFDPLFGAAHTFYGYSDLFGWQNLVNPAVYSRVEPLPGLRLEALYRLYWLASKEDAFVRASIQDPDGDSGRFVGQEVDLRLRYKFPEYADLDVGYAYFLPEDFVQSAAVSSDDSDFFYVSLRFKL